MPVVELLRVILVQQVEHSPALWTPSLSLNVHPNILPECVPHTLGPYQVGRVRVCGGLGVYFAVLPNVGQIVLRDLVPVNLTERAREQVGPECRA